MKFKIPFINKVVEVRSGLANPTEWLLKMLTGGTLSKANVNVTPELSLQISVVMACVKVISETIAMLPCILYKRSDKGKSKAENKDLYWLLHYSPNKETTAFDFWLMYVVNLLLTGDAFAYLKRDNSGKILEIYNIPTKNVTIYRNKATEELFYKVRHPDGIQEAIYYPENIMHTRGMRFTANDSSLHPIYMARDILGLSIAIEEYASKYFANGAQVGGIAKYPANLSDDAFDRFKEDFLKNYQGVVNSNKIMFLEDGADFVKVTNNPQESQSIEARKFQVIEICRIFNVPPHMVFDLEFATFSNIEAQYRGFVQFCLGPITVRIEQSIYKDLLNPTEKRKFFAKFLTNALLRGDTAARKDYYQAGIQNGWFCPNDVRELEDMNTYDGGDIFLVNGNMLPVSKILELFEEKIKSDKSKGGVDDEPKAGDGNKKTDDSAGEGNSDLDESGGTSGK